MAWIELHQSLPTDRKTLRLAEVLDLPAVHAMGHVISFWLWSIDNVHDGAMQGVSDRIIAWASGWPGDPHLFVQSLLQAGFLAQGTNGLVILDRPRVHRRRKIKREHQLERARPGRKQRPALRKAWERMAKKIRPLVFARDGHRCVYCGHKRRLEVDHILPLALGGSNQFENLQSLCLPCNRRKGVQ